MSASTSKHDHKSLCQIALRWLKRAPSAGGPGCSIALSECKTGFSGEVPDAIGFRRTGFVTTDGSVLIEVKSSRADFLADAKKAHRSQGGVGSWRYYLAPQGLIKLGELPAQWGLIEVNARGHTKAAAGFAAYAKGPHNEYLRQASAWRFDDVDMDKEQHLLVRVMANAGDPQKVLDRLRESNNRAAQLVSGIAKIASVLGLPESTPSSEIARYLRTMERRRLADLPILAAHDT